MNREIKARMIAISTAWVFGFGPLGASIAEAEDYTFVNDKEAIADLVEVKALEDAKNLTKSEVEEQNLALEDDQFIVVTYKNLAAWITSSSDFSPKIDGKNKAQKKGLEQLSTLATKAGLVLAIKKVNDEEGKPFTEKEIATLSEEALDRLEEVLASSDGLRRINERVDRDGIFSNNQFVVADYYLRISKEAILEEIQPSPIVLTFEVPEIDVSQFSSDTHYVARFVDVEVPIMKTKGEGEAQWAKGFEEAIFAISKEAFAKAVVAVNKGLRYPQQKAAIDQLIADYTASGQDKYRLIAKDYEVKKKEVWPKGSLRPRNSQDVLKVSAFFYFDREKIKSLVIPPKRAIALDAGSDRVVEAAPLASEGLFVGVYKDYTIEVPDDLETKAKARQSALDDAVSAFKRTALKEAANEIARRLSQPTNEGEIAKVLGNAFKQDKRFILEFGWVTQPSVLTRGNYSTAPETLKLSAYVTVDQSALQDLLIAEKIITIVGKYRTYVELFWNVPDKDINPEVVQTLLATVEDGLRYEGYEVVEFERIKGDLVTLLKNDDSAQDLYSSDERIRFKANLALRNIDSRFENGKRILADYADLVFGVTINSLEVVGNRVNVRVTLDATFFSQGEWMKLASFDSALQVPYVEGSKDHLIGVVKKAGINALAGIKTKVQSQLALRKDREELNLTQDREFTLVFAGMDKQQFGKVKKRLSKGSKWAYKRADFKSRSIYVAYVGNIDSLADMVQMYLEGADLDPGMGEYASGVNRILFGE
ncbi:MAG: hypothetical protein QF598_00240 [Arenicellales bacterium]|jgi:hypothetical protein|nr:hypothetical protein [Arenicellales bacterium]|tara:strand:+ start:2273 stop:4564 length:2292 start_codon:yes stop_codon:yes gene_type:complete